jgi:hypothetical protein
MVMRGPRSLPVAFAVLSACSLALSACAPPVGPETPPAAEVGPASAAAGGPGAAPAAPAPAISEGEQWDGVYQGPYHSYLAIQSKGEEVSGTWKSIAGRTGEFTGTIKKHRLELAWREHDQAGNSWTGRGYFLYRGPTAERPPQIYGEFGLGQARRGDAWWAVKRVDRGNGKGMSPADATSEEGKQQSDGTDDRLCPGCDEVEYER